MKTQIRRSGFTLPEILVTVTVVAVLAAVVVPAVTQFVSKGDSPATQADLTELRNAITAYSTDVRGYPGTFYDLESAPSGVATWKGPYTGAVLTGATGAGTFTSAGLAVKLGPSISSTGGYVSTSVSFVNNATCQDVWNLDKALDASTGAIADTATMVRNGSVTWSGACDGTDTGATAVTAGTPAITLRLMAKGV